MDTLVWNMGGGGRQEDYFKAGDGLARTSGRTWRRFRSRPREATEAFVFFKKIITDAVSTIHLPLSPESKVRLLRRLDAFLTRCYRR